MSDLVLRLSDTDATLRLGAQLASLLCAPPALSVHGPLLRAILLYGDMGSGKTTLVRGLVSALPGGAEAEIASPSFTLINSYPTTPPVLHADLFRCEPATPGGPARPSDIPDELDEALTPSAPRYGCEPALVLIEWAERLPSALLPAERLDISLQPCQAARLFLATAHGPAALRLCDSLKNTMHQ